MEGKILAKKNKTKPDFVAKKIPVEMFYRAYFSQLKEITKKYIFDKYF